jgi:hypothetical protein
MRRIIFAKKSFCGKKAITSIATMLILTAVPILALARLQAGLAPELDMGSVSDAMANPLTLDVPQTTALEEQAGPREGNQQAATLLTEWHDTSAHAPIRHLRSRWR